MSQEYNYECVPPEGKINLMLENLETAKSLLETFALGGDEAIRERMKKNDGVSKFGPEYLNGIRAMMLCQAYLSLGEPDGELLPMNHNVTLEGHDLVSLAQMPPPEYRDSYYQAMADILKKHNVVKSIGIAETWIAHANLKGKSEKARDEIRDSLQKVYEEHGSLEFFPGRREAIIITVYDSPTQVWLETYEIIRGKDKKTFDHLRPLYIVDIHRDGVDSPWRSSVEEIVYTKQGEVKKYAVDKSGTHDVADGEDASQGRMLVLADALILPDEPVDFPEFIN